MSSLIPSGSASGTGSMTLLAPVTNSNQTVTLPDVTGTVMVSGNMPAFSAYLSAAQNISASTLTKVAFNAENFDTANCFDSTTNYRFTPTVAGYYQINAMVNCVSGSANNLGYTKLYKNGSDYLTGGNAVFYFTSGGTSQMELTTSVVVYMNGSTDYLEIYGYNSGVTSPQFSSGCVFSGCLLRSA
jgi:hypothetical protein